MKNKPLLFDAILKKVKSLDFNTISSDRKEVLQALVDYIQSKKGDNKQVNLNFICTHNSRRSHLSQIWAQVAAFQYGVEDVACYSGGTEATALYPMVKETLEQTGFLFNQMTEEPNPMYEIKYSESALPILGFSKTYDDPGNPNNHFAAIMTCDHADQNCPFIPGAEKRIPVRYDDPKAFDNTPQQAEKYGERSTQIATEMMYVFSSLK